MLLHKVQDFSLTVPFYDLLKNEYIKQKKMSNIIDSIKNLIPQHKKKLDQQEFVKAAMGACALLAVADGEVSFAELMARDYLLDNIRQLHLFDANTAADMFRNCTEALEKDYQLAKSQILQVIAKFAEDKELAPLLLRISRVIAYADRDLKPAEEKMMLELGEILHLDKREIFAFIN